MLIKEPITLVKLVVSLLVNTGGTGTILGSTINSVREERIWPEAFFQCRLDRKIIITGSVCFSLIENHSPVSFIRFYLYFQLDAIR